MKKKILITCVNGVTCYRLLSSLKKNFIIYGTDINSIGAGKTMCDFFYKSPDPFSGKYIPFLKRIIKKVDLVFLYSDEELKTVSKSIKNKILNDKKILISEPKTIEVCLNKKKFNSFFSLKNDYFKLPKNKINKKNIIKPVEGHGSKNILVTKNKKIANFFLTLKKDFIIQEFIDGREFTVDCYFNKSNILENYLIRERMVKSNVSISSKIIKSDKKIEACIKYISKKMNFRGPINIQIIKHKKDLFLVEINPRLSGSISFSLEAGFDPFKLSTKEYLDHEIKVSHQLKTIYLHRYYEYIKKKKII